jgi:pullulanase
MLPSDLLLRRQTQFTFWRPRVDDTPPILVIGTFIAGNPNSLGNKTQIVLAKVGPNVPGLWALAAAQSGLVDGIYHYWFQVGNTNPVDPAAALILCTDPFATTVDWRLLSPSLPAGFNNDTDRQPAAVIRLQHGRLSAVDPGGESASFEDDPSPNTLPENNHLVIYELPSAWTHAQSSGINERGVGTFRDVLALVDETAAGANFQGLDVLDTGRSYLTELGVNALELLPPADSFFKRSWGYDTAHFLAPDWELGFPDGQAASTANADLAALVQSCHRHGIRFFIDVVMAFGRNEAYQWIDFDDFYIADPFKHPADPDAFTSRRGDGSQTFRDGFGSTVFRYTRPALQAFYDPISGNSVVDAPARALMYTYVTRWMRDFRVDGIRMDSVENVANWDFVGGFTNRARTLWNERWQAAGLGAGTAADERFLVVGEELSRPLELLTQGRLDALWNDGFRARVRAAILGQNNDGENFEFTVRNAIDCRNLGFADLAQAVNYVTSHDVEGFRKERLFTMLQKSGFGGLDLQKRVRLAFVCLLTANGIPMFLAGEEFADQNDLFDSNGNVTDPGGKEVDPVDFSRLQDPLRLPTFEYVSRLVHLRTSHPALGVNDTDFIHVDFNDNKRVLAWQRGTGGQDPVVVVANFSDFATPNGLADPNAEYVVTNWPPTPPGRHWREVTQLRDVLPTQIGREPIFSWEAKVYALA